MIAGLVTCVDYAPELARSLPLWRDTLDDLLVVTSPADEATVDLCERERVRFFATGDFYADPRAVFDKARAMTSALAELAPTDWLLLFDADIEPPPHWRSYVSRVEPGKLYGARRRQLGESDLLPDAEVAGFFAMWNVSDPRWTAEPGFGSWKHAGSFDSALMMRWPADHRIVLPLTLTHVGDLPGRNWLGRANPILDQSAWWAQRGDWTRERLDR